MKCPWLSIYIWKFPAQTEHEWVKNQISLHSTKLPTKYVNSLLGIWIYGSAKIIDFHSQNHRLVGDFPMQLNFIIHLMCAIEADTNRKRFYRSYMKLIFK